jgi:hypothetical protein
MLEICVIDAQEDAGLRLVTIFGEQKLLNARIQSPSMLENRVVLVKTA